MSDKIQFHISERDYLYLDNLCRKQRDAWLLYMDAAASKTTHPDTLTAFRQEWIEASHATCDQLQRVLMLHKLTADVLAIGPGHDREAGTGETRRALHAAFCAGIHHMAGQRELTPFELAEARRYVSEQEALSATPALRKNTEDGNR